MDYWLASAFIHNIAYTLEEKEEKETRRPPPKTLKRIRNNMNDIWKKKRVDR